MNGFAMLQALVFEPRKAFAALAERPRFAFPLLALILATAGLTFWYFQVVDVEWFTDLQMRGGNPGKVFDEARETMIAARAKSAGEHPGVTALFATAITALGVVIGQLIVSLYYLLAAKVTNVQRGFKHWLAFSCWTSMPSLLVVIPAAYVLMTTTSTQIHQGELQQFSLNALFFHREPTDPSYALLSGISVLSFVSLYLGALGVRIWSNRSWLFSWIFVLIPVALVLGVSALVTVGRS